ncbi:MAG: aldehyde dehydrogenase family protein, partial [Phycisphaerales bacterium]
MIDHSADLVSFDPARPARAGGRAPGDRRAAARAGRAARAALPAWAVLAPEARADRLRAWAEVTKRHAERIAALI